MDSIKFYKLLKNEFPEIYYHYINLSDDLECDIKIINVSPLLREILNKKLSYIEYLEFLYNHASSIINFSVMKSDIINSINNINKVTTDIRSNLDSLHDYRFDIVYKYIKENSEEIEIKLKYKLL